jgi:hypothetical protein
MGKVVDMGKDFVCFELIVDIKQQIDEMEKQLGPVLRPDFPKDEKVKEVHESSVVLSLRQILARLIDISEKISL